MTGLLGLTGPALLGLVAACLVLAALRDIAARLIPDPLPLLILAAGLGLRWLDGGLGAGLAAAAAVFLGCAALWWFGCLGGGDVKLLGAVSLVVRPGLVLPLLAYVALLGGVLSIVYLSLRRWPGLRTMPAFPLPRAAALWRRILRVEAWRIRRGGPLPYAVAIACGTIFGLMSE